MKFEMDQYKVKIEQFEGPLDLLLQLIEQDELDISNISLARVTDDYLNHVNASASIGPEELVDFLLVSAKLILIKSKMLLPNLEIDDEEGIDLETQLKMYREFVIASREINKMIRKRKWAFGREKVALQAVGFFPPKELGAGTLQDTFFKIIKKLEPFIALSKETLKKTISISEKIDHIKKIIENQVKTRFSEVVGKAKDKTEIIVSFLAILELAKQKVIKVSQESLFEDINIHRIKL